MVWTMETETHPLPYPRWGLNGIRTRVSHVTIRNQARGWNVRTGFSIAETGELYAVRMWPWG